MNSLSINYGPIIIHFQTILLMSDVLIGSELAARRQHPVLPRPTVKVDTSTTDRLHILPDEQVETSVAGIGSTRPAKNSARGNPETSGEDCWAWCGYLPTNTVLLRCVVCFQCRDGRGVGINYMLGVCSFSLFFSLSDLCSHPYSPTPSTSTYLLEEAPR